MNFYDVRSLSLIIIILFMQLSIIGNLSVAYSADSIASNNRELQVTSVSASSLLRRSEDVLTKIIELIDKAGLECLRCNWNSTIADKSADVLLVEVRASSIEQVQSFFNSLTPHWKWNLLSFNARPATNDNGEAKIQISCDLSLAPGVGESTPDNVQDLFNRIGRLAFFSMTSRPPSQAQLFGCHVEFGKTSEFQLIAPTLDQLLDAQTTGGFPARSRSLSRTDFLGGSLYTLDCNDQEGGFSVADMIAMSKTLSGAAALREISIPRDPSSDGLVRLTLDITQNQWSIVGNILTTGFGYDVLKVEAKGEPSAGAYPDAWSCTLFVRRTESHSFPSDLGNFIGAPWPASLKPDLELLWVPSSMRLLAKVSGEEDVSMLKAVADGLGLAYLGPQSRESLESNAMIVAFARQPPPPSVMPGPPPPGVDIGLEIDSSITQAGPQKRVKLEISEIPAFLQRLKNDVKQISKIELECQPPEKPVLTYVIYEDRNRQPQEQAIEDTNLMIDLASRLICAPLPWNYPLTEAQQSYILTGFTIEASSDEVTIRGATMKSRSIFNLLFPKLESISGIKRPYFREGNYSDYAGGRLMRFKITVDRSRIRRY